MSKESGDETADGARQRPELASGILRAGEYAARTRKMGGTIGIDDRQAEEDGAESVDLPTDLAQKRTSLALERTYLALERTLEAWVRTALSMISFGFTLGKLVQAVHGGQMKGIFGVYFWDITGLAYFLVIVGVGALVAAAVQNRLQVRKLYAAGLRRQFSIAYIVSLIVSLVGAFAFTSLVFEL